MNDILELPGEAAPLNPQQVLRALQSASSHQQPLIQTGAQQLQTWETQQGYYSLLQAAYLDKSLPTEVRYLAIIQLKNGIDKYWRKSATNAIKPDEKKHIRVQLLDGGIGEADLQLALQNALTISKVVRIDYPQDWPDVLTTLISILRTASDSNQLHLRRGLLMLLQIIKELATARLRRSQTSLQSVTPEIVFLLSTVYSQKVNQWTGFLAGTNEDEGGAIDAMNNSLLALKILRRLLISGYEYPNHDKDVQGLWAQSQLQFGPFLDMITRDPPILVSPAKDLVEKHLLQLAKLHVDMSKTHPASFALLPNSLELTRSYWSLIATFAAQYHSSTADPRTNALTEKNSKDDRSTLEKLTLKGLTLLRACIKMVSNPSQSFKYRTPEIKKEQTEAMNFINTQLLTDDLVRQMASTIVTSFFVFRQADLDAWEEEPDEWEIREEGGGDTWEFEVRPCSEKLFMDMVLRFKHLLVKPLMEFFQSVSGTDSIGVDKKDSVYTAMGLSAPVVFEQFDFDSFLKTTLVNDIQQTGPNFKILRRRVAILIGQWITIKVSSENRAIVYEIFKFLLDAQDPVNDQIVRVTAARQLKIVVDDFNFTSDSFSPHGAVILSRLLDLVKEVELTETKLMVLETVRVIAVRLEADATNFSDQIVAPLPEFWEMSGEEHVMKQTILALLSTLATAMKEKSLRYHPLILPLIQRVVEPGSEMHVYLMEEALDLWSAILTQTAAPASPQVMVLLESLFPLLETGFENQSEILSITESYVLLAPEAMLVNTIRLKLISYMATLLDVISRGLAGRLIAIVENVIRALDSHHGPEGVLVVVKDLIESGYSEKIMEGIHDAWEAAQTVGPDRRYPKLDEVVLADYFTILARIAVLSPQSFWTLLSSIGPAETVWEWVSTEWFRQTESMVNVERIKLSCLGLTRILELEPLMPLVLRKLQDYLVMWTRVILEMQDGRDDGGDNLVWTSPEEQDFEYVSAEFLRKQDHAARDVIHQVNTFQFVRSALEGVIRCCGGEAEFQQNWLVNIDKEVWAGFLVLVNGEVDR